MEQEDATKRWVLTFSGKKQARGRKEGRKRRRESERCPECQVTFKQTASHWIIDGFGVPLMVHKFRREVYEECRLSLRSVPSDTGLFGHSSDSVNPLSQPLIAHPRSILLDSVDGTQPPNVRLIVEC